MKNKFKCISHVERMNNKDVHYKYNEVLTKPYVTYVPVQEVKNGRVVKNLVAKTVDPINNFKGYKVTDFSIENLQACGAIANLKVATLDGSTFGSIDNASMVLSQLENTNI